MFGEGGLGGGEAVTKPPLSPLQFITHCHPELACWQAIAVKLSNFQYPRRACLAGRQGLIAIGFK